MTFKQYSVVRIKHLRRNFGENELQFNKRLPAVNDVATIVEVYTNPCIGYELECSKPDGTTEWLATLSPEDADLELIS